MRCVALALALLAAGCGAAVQRGPLRTVELLTAGAHEDDVLPVVVALHGRGGTPERFERVFDRFPVPARVALLEAPIAEAPGRAWFTWEWGANGASEEARDLVPRIEGAVRAFLAAHPARGRPVVTGFSQGAMLTYALVARRPALFAGALPVAGALLPHVLPLRIDAARAPPLHALHGDADEVVAVARDADAVATMRARGVVADLEVVHGATHWIGGALQERFQAELAAMLAAPR